MITENIKILTLFSGEVIVSQVDDKAATHLLLRSPYTVMVVPDEHGKPSPATMMWMPAALAQDQIVTVFAGAIASMSDPSDSTRRLYQKHVSTIVQPSSGIMVPAGAPTLSPNQTITL